MVLVAKLRGTLKRVLQDGHTAMRNLDRPPGSFSLSDCTMSRQVVEDGPGSLTAYQQVDPRPTPKRNDL